MSEVICLSGAFSFHAYLRALASCGALVHAAVCVTMALIYKDLNGLKFSLNGLWGLTKMMSGLNGLRSFSY